MNKYQKALDGISFQRTDSDIEGYSRIYDLCPNEISFLQELVEMREEALLWCNSVLESNREVCTFPNGERGDTGYCIELAKPIFDILKGDEV